MGLHVVQFPATLPSNPKDTGTMKILFFLLSLLPLASRVSSKRIGAKPSLDPPRFLSKRPHESSFKQLAQKIKSAKQTLGRRNSTNATAAPFNPETDDILWPGSFPSTNNGSKEDLMINIRLDDYPDEVSISAQLVFAQTPMSPISAISKNFIVQNGTKPGQLQSYAVEDFDQVNALYRIQITDESGDGICCGYGNGW